MWAGGSELNTGSGEGVPVWVSSAWTTETCSCGTSTGTWVGWGGVAWQENCHLLNYFSLPVRLLRKNWCDVCLSLVAQEISSWPEWELTHNFQIIHVFFAIFFPGTQMKLILSWFLRLWHMHLYLFNPFCGRVLGSFFQMMACWAGQEGVAAKRLKGTFWEVMGSGCNAQRLGDSSKSLLPKKYL